MSEMLFVEVLRRYADSFPPGRTGWLAAIRDPAVGRALALMTRSPRKRGRSSDSASGRALALDPSRALRPFYRAATDAVPRAVADATCRRLVA